MVPTRNVCTILKQKPQNFTTNTLKAYLCAQASTLSAFVITKTHVVAQKPRRGQLNAKVCSSESALFVFFLAKVIMFNNDIVSVLTVILAWNWCLSQYRALLPFSVFVVSKSSWSAKHHNTGSFLLRRMPFRKFVCMCTCSLVPRLNTMSIGLGTTLVYKPRYPMKRLYNPIPGGQHYNGYRWLSLISLTNWTALWRNTYKLYTSQESHSNPSPHP